MRVNYHTWTSSFSRWASVVRNMKLWPVATFEQHHPIVERFVKHLKMPVCSLAENSQISDRLKI
jgi:hypothetical protein